MRPGRYLIWGLFGAAAIVAAAMFISQSTDGSSAVFADGSQIRATAVLSGRNQSYAFDSFTGGRLNALMGGMELDLRESTIVGDMAVIDMFVMMGGIELRVPEDWDVSNEVTMLMGGIEDKTVTTDRPTAKRLVLRGTVLMGGVTLRN